MNFYHHGGVQMQQRMWRRSILFGLCLILVATAAEQPVFAAPAPAKYGPLVEAGNKPPCPTSRLDKASAMFAARQCGGKVEVLDLRSETTVVWAEADGSYTSEKSLGVARFQRDGQWVDVNLELERRSDGSVAPKAHASGVTLAGAGGKELAALGSGEGKLSLEFEGKLPEPVLRESVATYPEVYPGIDIVVEVRRYGYEQSFIVKDRAAVAHVPAALRALRMLGPPAEPDGRGGLVFRDKAGKRVGSAPAPLMWDAARERGDRESASVKRVGLSLDAKKRVATLTAEMAWLNDPARSFPITIDPYEQQDAHFDTYVMMGQTSPYDDDTTLAIGTQNSGVTQRMAYVNVTAADMRRATVNFATLKMWSIAASRCANDDYLLFVPVTNANESTTWNSRPDLYDVYGNIIGKDGSGFGTTPPSAAFGKSLQASGGCTGRWLEADAAEAYRFAIAHNWGTFTLALTPVDRHTNVFYKEFKSLDSGTLPHVMINWNDPPQLSDVDTSPSGASGSCVSGSNRPYVTSKTPQLAATVTDSDSAPANVTFEWWVTGGAIIGSQTVNNVPNGSVAKVTVPAAALSEGGTYSWRAMGADPSGSPTSEWTSWCEFTVDTIKPGTPIVTSKDGMYPQTSTHNTWGHGGYGQQGKFTITPGVPTAGLASFTYQMDNESTSTTVSAAAAVDIDVKPTEDGVRTLTVTAKDVAGNVSNQAKYIFNVGLAGLSQPRPGANVFKRTNLDVDGDAAYTRARFQVRRGPGAPEYDIPWTNLTTAAGQPVSGGAGQPVTISSLGNYGVWNATDTLGSVGGVAQVRARLYGNGGFRPDLSVQHPSSGRCLDLLNFGQTNTTPLNMHDCHGGTNQRFELRPGGSIVNPISGRCLDVANGGTADGTPIWLFDCHGGANQKFERLADGQIRNPSSGKCLNISGGAPYSNGQLIVLYTCIGADNMVFTEVETSYNTQWITINVDPAASGAARVDVGPGSVNLITGEVNVGGADASAFGLGTARTLSTRDNQAGRVPQKERLTTAGQQATDLSQYSAGLSTIRVVTGRGQGGSNESLEITPATSTVGNTYAAVGGDTGGMRLGMQAGKRYRATGWIYVPAATSINPPYGSGQRIVAYANAGSGYVEFPSPKATFVDGWQELSVDFTIPAGATEAFIRVYNGQPAGTGKVVFWDNLSVREIIAPFGPQWSSSAGGGPAGVSYTGLEFPSADVVKVNSANGSYLTFGRSTSGTFFPSRAPRT
ncbi:hypothetical protein Prum_071560 [Phytohabitans rumicis]|uniref:Ricin B lectin domain-containing protein n=1 Tax=Phytohabitans rumicis TaxID=1076125 RepID=A0A6V8LAY2_9ACTN|nr:hypothetical protein Prum_071560 [Phytohabitans rumicis]